MMHWGFRGTSRSNYFVQEPIDEGSEIDVKIIENPHRGLIDPDLPSQIRWRSNDHSIANRAADGFLKIFYLLL